MKKTNPIADPRSGEATPLAAPGANLHLMHGRLLARNVIWNLIGNGAPMIVAVFCIPILIRGLGTDRFGVLALERAELILRSVNVKIDAADLRRLA